MTERPFIPRPPGLPAWWAREATAEEFAALASERLAAEMRQRERVKAARGETD